MPCTSGLITVLLQMLNYKPLRFQITRFEQFEFDRLDEAQQSDSDSDSARNEGHATTTKIIIRAGQLGN